MNNIAEQMQDVLDLVMYDRRHILLDPGRLYSGPGAGESMYRRMGDLLHATRVAGVAGIDRHGRLDRTARQLCLPEGSTRLVACRTRILLRADVYCRGTWVTFPVQDCTRVLVRCIVGASPEPDKQYSVIWYRP